MNPFLTLAGFYIPDFIKKRKIRELFDLTARSFQCAVPNMKGLSYPELLSSYARFTQSIAETALHNNACGS